MGIPNSKADRQAWLDWLEGYGAEEFLRAFLHNVEGAESTCIYCKQKIYVDVLIGGGVPDWSTEDGDFGCGSSPETSEEGTGSHMPRRRNSRIR